MKADRGRGEAGSRAISKSNRRDLSLHELGCYERAIAVQSGEKCCNASKHREDTEQIEGEGKAI